MYTLRNKDTGHIPLGCKNVPTYRGLVEGFRQWYCIMNQNAPSLQKWAEDCSDEALMKEAHFIGFEEYEDKEAMQKMREMREELADEDFNDLYESKSKWKEDANEFRKLATKLGLLSDTLEDYDDTDPAEYEEQQFDDWAEEIIRQMSPYNS